ncbi:hypothetical protein ACQP1G_37190 [Nocardia sp. CA-107356]|uniref:hypothetical protein n=1 Tax=Nocardia sp. CA-107356 TaxID=3239972 RepID=UPI003D8D8064
MQADSTPVWVSKNNFTWPATIQQKALPDQDFQTTLTPEQELHVLEVLFDALGRFLGARESTS